MNRDDCEKLLDAFEMSVIECESAEWKGQTNVRAIEVHDNLYDVIIGLMASRNSITMPSSVISTNPKNDWLYRPSVTTCDTRRNDG